MSFIVTFSYMHVGSLSIWVPVSVHPSALAFSHIGPYIKLSYFLYNTALPPPHNLHAKAFVDAGYFTECFGIRRSVQPQKHLKTNY
jgi:hypothetical protein